MRVVVMGQRFYDQTEVRILMALTSRSHQT